tara:strand:+ start:3002 stop:3322 length:321 start_codon:yes stop_codon:yes gene_type:complete
MHHYEQATKETIFTYRGDSSGEVYLYLCGKFLETAQTRIPMKRCHRVWKASVRLPVGMYPYHFEVDGRHVPDSGGTIKVRQTTPKTGRWSLAIVPRWVSMEELAKA